MRVAGTVPPPLREAAPPTREVLLPLGTRTSGVLPPLLQGVDPLINGVPKVVAVVATLHLHGAARRAAARRPLTPHPAAVLHPAALSGAVAAVAGARAVAVVAAVVPVEVEDSTDQTTLSIALTANELG